MSRLPAGPVRVVVDGGVLRDGRATAGIGRYLRSLLAALRDAEDVDVILSVPSRVSRSERHPLRYLHSQPRLALTAARRAPQLVHSVTSEPALVWPLRRQVVTIHDVIPWSSPAHRRRAVGRAYFEAQRRRLRRCAALIAVSPGVAAEAAVVLGLPQEAISVVGEGVDATFRAEPRPDDAERRERLGAGGSAYVLWAGSMLAHDPRKNLDTLVAAAACLRRGHPDTVLVLAGRPGREAERVRDAAARAGVPVVLPGYVSDADLAALYRGAAAVTLPSSHEGFGLTALEAMACGAPLVATHVGNLPELVGDAGVLVPPGDARALAQALAAVLASEVGDRLRAAGPRRAAGHTWERAARETAEVYRRAARRVRGSEHGSPT